MNKKRTIYVAVIGKMGLMGYVVLLVPSELKNTFSARNMQILTMGIYLLICMCATGPFYGFGEYTYLRELGLCTADLTSPNLHSYVWDGIYVLIAFIIPYAITLTSLSVLYVRHGRHGAYADKDVIENDVHFTNTFCTMALLTCSITLLYFAVCLSNADGVGVSPDLMFWSSYCVSSRTLLVIVVLKLWQSHCKPSHMFSCCCKRLMRLCGVYRHGAMTYELTEFEYHNSTSRAVVQGTTPLMTHVK